MTIDGTAVIVTLITSVTTIITGWLNRRTTRNESGKIHDRIDTLTGNTGEMKADPVTAPDRVRDVPLERESPP